MSRATAPILLFAIFLAFLPRAAWAADQDTGKFVFYYQQIEKVIPLEPEKPPVTLWEKTKAFFNKGVNVVRKYSEIAFRRCLLPGEGTKTWYGLNNSSYAYQVRRTKVHSEQHLLQLMGAGNGDLSKLTNGQRSLLELYRNANNDTLKDLSRKALVPRIIVHLSDTTGFDDQSRYPKVEDDFWPMSMGLSITMPSGHYNYPGGEKSALRTFVHETAHCTNLTLPNYTGYGPDGHHSRNEMTKPRSAYQEAWSEYQELLFDKNHAATWGSSFKSVRFENPKKAGDYENVPFSDPRIDGTTMFSIEAVNAWILYRLATELPNGRAKVDAAFFKKNVPWGNMQRFLRTFAAMNPGDAIAMFRILGEVSEGKLSPAAIGSLLRVPVPASVAAGEATPSTGTAAAAPEPSAASQVVPRVTRAVNKAGVDLKILQKRYEDAYLAYVRAAQNRSGEVVEGLKRTLLKAKAELAEALR